MYGGILWFPDLSVADPYYILPVFTAVTMLITMEVCISYLNMMTYILFFLSIQLGIETGMRTANLGPVGRNALRVLPFLSLIFTVNFSSVILFSFVFI